MKHGTRSVNAFVVFTRQPHKREASCVSSTVDSPEAYTALLPTCWIPLGSVAEKHNCRFFVAHFNFLVGYAIETGLLGEVQVFS